ncbi:PhzF family phenazine biosynthesis protein [Nocardia sp. CDC153]|uniref:PhzF family phenazine biosynthesis protein n=1 Tax=Nocardia sp. CDC153 TaxID=3112167 RepID=UPI002DBB4FBE|nr:PhzF family phenazine biosynthesis protein [Nocardia sp. CDC153]MEC3952771.1 PhzF family phenazine biosynthesis protein [Nocardia sp. CDC153]
MRIRVVDAFADRPFRGNPAGVCLVLGGAWPAEGWMQAVAGEVNLSETAFVKPSFAGGGGEWDLRWFTPTQEIRICGHATLAAAHVLVSTGSVGGMVRFHTLSGVLTARPRSDGAIELDFPASPVDRIDAEPGLAEALGAAPVGVYDAQGLDDIVVELSTEGVVRALEPDMAALMRLQAKGVIVTAVADEPTGEYAFVSRCFGPQLGIPEDPVTGSAHTALAPFWAARFGRSALTGLQVSARSGLVETEIVSDRVLLIGRAVTVIDGELHA